MGKKPTNKKTSVTRAATKPAAARRSAPRRDERAEELVTSPEQSGSFRDPRLPPVGTTIIKRDRHGAPRCECTVEDAGIRYRGVLYRSLSAAASAAAVDLGLKPTQNGFVFWSIVKPGLTGRNLLDYGRALHDRHRARVAALLEHARSDGERARLRRDIEAHSQTLTSLLQAGA